MTVERFYDRLAPFYHLIFPDWEASIQRQAAALDSIVREHWGAGPWRILDVACGIGTQALGLAGLGHAVTASDLSAAAVDRAREEAARRGLAIDFFVADMRALPAFFHERFDLVIACDNAVPHLLSDGDILQAFGQMFGRVRPGGGCLITVRDYDREERSGVQVKPYGIRAEGGTRYLVFQVWDFDGDYYDLAMYFVEDHGGPRCSAQVMRSRYYAVGTGKLLAILEQAGFRDVQRIDGRFYQPVLVGKRP
jgi:SAM-dependent methyltransferase